jgi:hypothetical protein
VRAAEIANALGDARREGPDWRCLCPVCGKDNLNLRDDTGPLKVYCWSNCDFKSIFRELRERGFLNGRDPDPPPPPPNDPKAAAKTANALDFWRNSTSPLSATLGDTYLASRLLLQNPLPATLRFASAVYHPTERRTFPAVVGLLEHQTLGERGIHCICLNWLDPSVRLTIDPRKFSSGRVKGAAVRLFPAGPELALGEGVETCLAFQQSTQIPAWATVGATGLINFEPPPLDAVSSLVLIEDQDGAGRKAVSQAARRFSAMGYRVRIARPRQGKDVNDALLAIGPAEPICDIEDYQPPPPSDRRFIIQNGRIVYLRAVQGSQVATELTNFTASLVEDQIYDDGALEVRRYVIDGQLDTGERLRRIIVPVKQFTGAGWTDEHWGARPIVQPGQGPQMLCAAIKTLSGPVRQHRIFGHIGWRRIDDEWVYLHASGALGENGPVQDVSVELDPPLDGYRLPDPPDNDDLKAAIQASINLLELNVALAATVYRAPLIEFCPSDHSLFHVGVTDSLKSALQACGQAHWGRSWNGRHFPDNWASTANHIEVLAFRAKDALMVIDDFVVQGSRHEVDALHAKAERVFRGAGNLSGRGRMGADTTLRPEYYPRAMLAASGEDLPRGHSLRARLVIDQIGPGDITLDKLEPIQNAAAAGRLAQAMAAYIQWIAKRANDSDSDLAGALRRRQTKIRNEVAATHRRTAHATASLMLGVEEFLAFAASTAAMTNNRWLELVAKAKFELRNKAQAQSGEQAEENPVVLFLGSIPSLLDAGRAHLTDKDGTKPALLSLHSTSVGWRRRERETLTGIREEWEPRGDRIGVVLDGQIAILPDPAIAAVNHVLAQQGRSIALSRSTLGKRLRDAGYLVDTDKCSFTKTKRIGTAIDRFFVIAQNKLFPPEAEPEEETAP